MKKISTIFIMLCFILLYAGGNTTLKKIIENDDRYDNMLENQLESQYSSLNFLSDRTLGLIATINGISYYVNRVEDAGNFKLQLIDMETGNVVSSLPYLKLEDFKLDDSGNYYIIDLPNGETLHVPVWMNSNNIQEVLQNYSGIPIYYNGQLIGVTIFLTANIQLSIYQPFYGVYSVSFKNLKNKLFENMKLDFYFYNKNGEKVQKLNLKKKVKKNKKKHK